MNERLDIDIPVCSECGRLCFSGPPCPEHPMTKLIRVGYRRVEDCEAALAAANARIEELETGIRRYFDSGDEEKAYELLDLLDRKGDSGE